MKMHKLYEIQTDIQTFIHIAKVHDQYTMNVISYEEGAYYVFDRGYFDLERLYHKKKIEAYLVIRQRKNLEYKVIKVNETSYNENGENIE